MNEIHSLQTTTFLSQRLQLRPLLWRFQSVMYLHTRAADRWCQRTGGKRGRACTTTTRDRRSHQWRCHCMDCLLCLYATSSRRPSSTMCSRVVLPLFYEKSATTVMIKHGMDVVRQAVEFLNLVQILDYIWPTFVCASKICKVEKARH